MSETMEKSMLFDLEQEIEIHAAPDKVFRGIIEQLKNLDTDEPGKTLSLELEEWPGGRWFRDLGAGSGHLWGFVQSIKPPTLIELYGPLMISSAVANNLIIRIEAVPNGAKAKLRHQCLGKLPDGYEDGMGEGWNMVLEGAKRRVEG